jgi:hypothetical protein
MPKTKEKFVIIDPAPNPANKLNLQFKQLLREVAYGSLSASQIWVGAGQAATPQTYEY